MNTSDYNVYKRPLGKQNFTSKEIVSYKKTN